MLADCRECGQPVASRAKVCPHCGVRKPNASKAEAGLDAFAAGAFKLGILLCLLAVVVVACIAVVACSGPSSPNVEERQAEFEKRQAEAGYDPQGRPLTTADTRPVYCGDFDTWAAAEAEMDALEARHGPDTSTWAAADVDALFAAMDRRAAAVERVWAQAPDSATVGSVRAACG